MKRYTKKSVQLLINDKPQRYSLSNDNGLKEVILENGRRININNLRSDKICLYLNELGFYAGDSYLKTDEFYGLCQANELGINPYECTILSN